MRRNSFAGNSTPNPLCHSAVISFVEHLFKGKEGGFCSVHREVNVCAMWVCQICASAPGVPLGIMMFRIL
jgi:hypothetical protein